MEQDRRVLYWIIDVNNHLNLIPIYSDHDWLNNDNPNNLPPNILDCGNGNFCDCDTIYKALSKARYELHLLKLRDELPTGEI